jgi:hypothetical protein
MGGPIADYLIENEQERERVQSGLGWMPGRVVHPWMPGRLEKPFYWATYATHTCKGKFVLLEEPFVPYAMR